MKNFLRLLGLVLAVALVVTFAACKGTEGPQGPQGEPGYAGGSGEDGVDGLPYPGYTVSYDLDGGELSGATAIVDEVVNYRGRIQKINENPVLATRDHWSDVVGTLAPGVHQLAPDGHR